jgi:hypothetical protein
MSRKHRILVTDATGIVGYVDPECIGPNETCRRLAQTGVHQLCYEASDRNSRGSIAFWGRSRDPRYIS